MTGPSPATHLDAEREQRATELILPALFLLTLQPVLKPARDGLALRPHSCGHPCPVDGAGDAGEGTTTALLAKQCATFLGGVQRTFALHRGDDEDGRLVAHLGARLHRIRQRIEHDLAHAQVVEHLRRQAVHLRDAQMDRHHHAPRSLRGDRGEVMVG